MLAFIDESGHPHPNDSSSRPAIVAVCISEKDARRIAGRIHGLKRDVLGRERMEVKGASILNRRTFRRKPDYWGFAEEFFSALLNLPLTIFCMGMYRPAIAPDTQSLILPD